MTDPNASQEFSIPPQFRRKRPPRWIVPLVTFGVLGVIIAGSFGVFGSFGPKPFTAHGTVSLTTADYNWEVDRDGEHCVGKGAYDDITGFTTVRITDEDGDMISFDSFEDGVIEGQDCVFRFSMTGVRAGRSSYGLEVGDRGAFLYSQRELANGVALTIR